MHVLLALCIACSLLLSSSAANGQSPRIIRDETREFEIRVKGKSAGTSSTRIVDFDDGTTVATTNAGVKLDYLIYVYRYDFQGSETWRGNQLIAVDNQAVDDGKKLTARVKIDQRGVVVEDRSHEINIFRSLDMTTNYWRVPDPSQWRAMSIMNADQGTVHTVHVEHSESESVVVAGRKMDCTHYRIGGALPADLWFDATNRIVRQKTIEDGYPTELWLTRLTTAETIKR